MAPSGQAHRGVSSITKPRQGEGRLGADETADAPGKIAARRTRKETMEVPDSLPAELPENDAEMEGLKASFRRMIYSLPEPYLEALVLTEFEGLSQKQLAERLGISLSGAKSRVQRD